MRTTTQKQPNRCLRRNTLARPESRSIENCTFEKGVNDVTDLIAMTTDPHLRKAFGTHTFTSRWALSFTTLMTACIFSGPFVQECVDEIGATLHSVPGIMTVCLLYLPLWLFLLHLPLYVAAGGLVTSTLHSMDPYRRINFSTCASASHATQQCKTENLDATTFHSVASAFAKTGEAAPMRAAWNGC